MHVSMQEMVLFAKMVSTRLLNFVRFKVVIFPKWQSHLQKGFVHKPFLNPIIILCGGKYFYQSNNFKLFTKIFSQNLMFRVSRFNPNHSPKVFTPKTFS